MFLPLTIWYIYYFFIFFLFFQPQNPAPWLCSLLWPRQPQKGLRWIFLELYFWNQSFPTKKMRYITGFLSKSLFTGGVFSWKLDPTSWQHLSIFETSTFFLFIILYFDFAMLGNKLVLSYYIVSYRIVLYRIVRYRLVLNCIVSYHIVSYRIVSYHIILYRIVSYCIISYRIVSYRIISYHIISYRIISYHIISYHIISYCNQSNPGPYRVKVNWIKAP